MNKSLFLMFSVLCLAQQAHAEDLWKRAEQIGCGTVTSVRKLNQSPLFNQEYLNSIGGSTNAGDVATIASRVVPFGEVAAVAISIGVAAVVDAAKREPTPVVGSPRGGAWKNVSAVRIQMDDGRVINLPLMNADLLVRGHEYKTDQRLSLTFSKYANAIQIAPKPFKTPIPGSPSYSYYCGVNGDKDLADAAIRNGEHLVNEANIIAE